MLPTFLEGPRKYYPYARERMIIESSDDVAGLSSDVIIRVTVPIHSRGHYTQYLHVIIHRAYHTLLSISTSYSLNNT